MLTGSGDVSRSLLSLIGFKGHLFVILEFYENTSQTILLFLVWQVTDVVALLPLGYNEANGRKSCIGCARVWNNSWHAKFDLTTLDRESITVTRLMWERWLSIWFRNGNTWDISCWPANILNRVDVGSGYLVTADLPFLISGAQSHFIRRRNQHVSVQLLPGSTSTLHPSSPFTPTDATSPQSPRGGFPNPPPPKTPVTCSYKVQYCMIVGGPCFYSHFTLFSKHVYY
jgi:hypothetical protein